ncbi:MAG: dTDP-4-dehydrorhamnose 3,5-epimerase family protein [Reichenbachiella sp.]|uniref:dTDP-4-dehydrorhamnose 3,5-epimerase family protein n=1 Tax=Reichenbachiella sp. TaxID=2184521 RepID=UPI003299932E
MSVFVKTKVNESSLIQGKTIHESRLVKIEEHSDYRGSFSEIFQKYWGTVLDPVQWSLVKSEPGVLRGMHYHRRHDEYFCLIQGSCYLGLKDMRPDSPTYMESNLYYLTESDLAALVFPKGIVHGWYFIEKSVHVQSVSESYLDYGSEDNFGCRWNDPDLNIEWPFNEAIISNRAGEQFHGVKDLPLFK